MVSKKNKELHVDKEALSTLSLIKEGLLHPLDKIMSEKEARIVCDTEIFNGKHFPMSFTFAPNGKKNQENIKNAKKGEKFDLIVDGEKRGEIVADEVFKVNQFERIDKFFGNADSSAYVTNQILKRLGKYAICGDYEVDCNDIKNIKNKIKNAITKRDAKTVSAVMLKANPFHRAHERLLRITLEKSDLLVIFLIKSHDKENVLPFELRLKTLEYFVEHYLHKDKIIIVPFDSTFIFADQKNAVLDAIVAKNLGCNKIVFGEFYNALGIYYDNNQMKTALDEYDARINADIISSFVYCNECKTLVNDKTCPHGAHHHIKYNSKSILALIKSGILPPAILMRKDISAILLSHLFPNRFENFKHVYFDLFPGTGLVESHSDRDFYLELMKLYQTTSLT
ncbi:MAG: sulfate adenylyltransferase [Campylobacteraceae bacterium]